MFGLDMAGKVKSAFGMDDGDGPAGAARRDSADAARGQVGKLLGTDLASMGSPRKKKKKPVAGATSYTSAFDDDLDV